MRHGIETRTADWIACALVLVVSACDSPPRLPDPPATHPASPRAAEAPVTKPPPIDASPNTGEK